MHQDTCLLARHVGINQVMSARFFWKSVKEQVPATRGGIRVTWHDAGPCSMT
ncbi:hypothetical protein HanRHA438_Chr01g0046491 [Helianthus annuus]|nr:hypothetical protein HanIR_Chr01g0050631 [Helianthus annuus]KAJ0950175.1 hypothetical protein HanRHA438_Chr01g0046491 [Helianthus annuus]